MFPNDSFTCRINESSNFDCRVSNAIIGGAGMIGYSFAFTADLHKVPFLQTQMLSVFKIIFGRNNFLFYKRTTSFKGFAIFGEFSFSVACNWISRILSAVPNLCFIDTECAVNPTLLFKLTWAARILRHPVRKTCT